jgi:hypothetical protein
MVNSMPTIHLSAHHITGKRFLAVGENDQQARLGLYTSVASGDIPNSFTISHEVYCLMKNLAQFESIAGSEATVIEQAGEEWFLRREVAWDGRVYKVDDLPGVKTYQL